MDTIVVAANPAMVALLYELDLVPEGAEVKSHVEADEIIGKHVVGMLPYHMAHLAFDITLVPLTLDPHRRGQRLGLNELRDAAGTPETYTVTRNA